MLIARDATPRAHDSRTAAEALALMDDLGVDSLLTVNAVGTVTGAVTRRSCAAADPGATVAAVRLATEDPRPSLIWLGA